MPTTQTAKEFDEATALQAVALSTRYVATLLARIFDLPVETVNRAIVNDVLVITQEFRQHGTSGEIPENLVKEVLQRQADTRILEWNPLELTPPIN